MTSVAIRDLRNHTATLIEQVKLGKRLTITRRGEPVAVLSPATNDRPQYLTKAQFLSGLVQADPALRQELADLDQSTEELELQP